MGQRGLHIACPRDFSSLFGWQLAIFLISCFFSLACWELLTHVMDYFSKQELFDETDIF